MSRREEAFQIAILQQKPYLVEWSAKEEGDEKCPKNCPHGL